MALDIKVSSGLWLSHSEWRARELGDRSIQCGAPGRLVSKL